MDGDWGMRRMVHKRYLNSLLLFSLTPKSHLLKRADSEVSK